MINLKLIHLGFNLKKEKKYISSILSFFKT